LTKFAPLFILDVKQPEWDIYVHVCLRCGIDLSDRHKSTIFCRECSSEINSPDKFYLQVLKDRDRIETHDERCPDCRLEIKDENAHYCSNCGKRLSYDWDMHRRFDDLE